MEIDQSNFWLDEKHPNFILWKRTRDLAYERGKFVESLISNYHECRNKTILNLGCGEGITSAVLFDNNFVISCDLNKIKISSLKLPNKIICDIKNLPLREYKFDIIILQDVLEHLTCTDLLFKNLNELLKKEGIVYISTPNKYSIINIISDPHWNVPVVSILKREFIRRSFLKYFRKSEIKRTDIAQLLSLREIQLLSSLYFQLFINTKFAFGELLKGKQGIVWSRIHVLIVKFLRNSGLGKLLLSMINDNIGIINKFLTSTFYLILKKKDIQMLKK
jgi:2-polyprenyl-3-methyl-5-hydroxy-6-metoxy-1,4-benzoquinol methylase